jgi:DNA-binding transcriptional ArsR family regulator
MDTIQSPNKSQVPHRPAEIDRYVDEFLSTVCDTSRRYILELLAEPHEGSSDLPQWRSGDIARAIGLSPATTSEHLRQLTRAGLLTSQRRGNTVHYQLCNHMLVQAFRDLLFALDRDYAKRSSTNQ